MGTIKKETQVDQRFVLSGPRKTRLSLPSPEEGRRLVTAFMGVKDAVVRDAIIDFIEKVSLAHNDLQ